MPAPGEHKTVQARILNYAREIRWIDVPRAEAARRRGFDSILWPIYLRHIKWRIISFAP